MYYFNDTSTTEIYTLSLHDALPISRERDVRLSRVRGQPGLPVSLHEPAALVLEAAKRDQVDAVDHLLAPCERTDRKSTRLNSSHANNSYAVFCLKINNLVFQITRLC